ncbi:unnamed protein product [Protopolystoma xenopodis]|uniref:G-protein coupled receptors family 1 profile domain-containing protein n=1 Tax=Protopolystoma xenopodis TaxID=117903 RepID=A0A448XEB8_9PLAT|nr:unnamed protein product [Protopolystoma xenopodis]
MHYFCFQAIYEAAKLAFLNGLVVDKKHHFVLGCPVSGCSNSTQGMKFGAQSARLLVDHSFDTHDEAFKCSPIDNLLNEHPFSMLMKTRLQPPVILITLITNCLTAVVLTRPEMRSPTNILLFSISLADLFTGCLALPIYLSAELFRENITVVSGYLVSLLTVILPTIFHTAAIWLTVVLALQRFFYVHFPLRVHRICVCQKRGVTLTVAAVFTAAIVWQLPNEINTSFVWGLRSCRLGPQEAASNPAAIGYNGSALRLDEVMVFRCTEMSSHFFFTFLILRVLFVHFGPCLTLTVFTCLLILALHKFARKRRALLSLRRGLLLRQQTPQETTNSVGPIHRTSLIFKLSDGSVASEPERRTYQTYQSWMPGSGSKDSLAADRLVCANACGVEVGGYVSGGSGGGSGSEGRNTGGSTGGGIGDIDSTSNMMLVVLGVFLLVEVPTTVILIMLAAYTILEIQGPKSIAIVSILKNNHTCSFLSQITTLRVKIIKPPSGITKMLSAGPHSKWYG